MKTRKAFLSVRLDDHREASTFLIVAFLLIHTGLSALYNLVIFRNGWLRPISNETFGLINSTLILNVLSLFLVVGALLMWAGKLRLTDIGLDPRQLRSGLTIILASWVLMQAVTVALSLVQTSFVTLNATWTSRGAGVVIGGLLAQLLGNALYEETVFRGFLLTQFYKKLRHKWTEPTALTLAIILSQAVFSLSHIPNRLYLGLSLADMAPEFPVLLLIGAFFALIYHRTGNLFVAVGIHALSNTPTFLAEVGPYAIAMPYLFGLIIILVWPRLNAFYLAHSRAAKGMRKKSRCGL